jgi:MFS family permease
MTAAAPPPPSSGSLLGLDLLNFSVAAMQAGFGAFVAVRLTASGWTQGAIGEVLSASTIAAIAAQVPSGVVIDRFAAKRELAAAAILTSAAALLLLAINTSFAGVLAAEIAQGGAGAGLTLAIAAITLSISRQAKLGERLGNNVRFAAVGAALGALGLGLAGRLVSPPAVFLLAAGFGVTALLGLRWIGTDDLATAHLRTSHLDAPPPHRRRTKPVSPRRLLRDRRLWALMGCVALFQLANAALLPLASGGIAERAPTRAYVFTAAAVILPQLITAVLSPRIGALAQIRGRRPLLMLGLAAVPLRALMFAVISAPLPTLAVQLLDGVSAATIGVLVPLIVADITHHAGRFNLALGALGLASAAGASVSTSAAGAIADMAGLPAAFAALAAAGAAAILLVWAWLPETAHLPSIPPNHVPGAHPHEP